MRRFGVALVVVALSAGLAVAGGGFGLEFGQADLDALTDALGDVASFPNLGTAAPGGLAGFQILGAAGGPQIDTSSRWWGSVPHTNVVGDLLVGQRVIVRKGLPLRLDVGVQVGKALGDQFWGADLRWAFVEAGTLQPAVALRVAYSHVDSSVLASLEVEEAQLVMSKGFPIVSLYGAAGYRRVEGHATFGDPLPLAHSSTRTGVTGTVGAQLSLLPFLHLVGEVRRGANTCVFVGLGVGH
ncbi:MAG: hypothetical protein LAO05_17715 [Acidobacteriia bacterium]|nr:hypothetical protein [Terriglobia bacterium]